MTEIQSSLVAKKYCETCHLVLTRNETIKTVAYGGKCHICFIKSTAARNINNSTVELNYESIFQRPMTARNRGEDQRNPCQVCSGILTQFEQTVYQDKCQKCYTKSKSIHSRIKLQNRFSFKQG